MNHLLVFAKRPILGKVKTRLAKDLGEKNALEVYKFLLEHTARISNPRNHQKWKTHWFWDELPISENIGSFEYLLPDSFSLHSQIKGDLGERMEGAFLNILEAKKYEQGSQIIIIGSDCLELNSDILLAAFENLETSDIVIGPAFDGGYYLLGMKSLKKELFQGIEWSSNTVFSSTMEKIQSLNLSVYILPTLRDIDRALDLKNTNIKSFI